MQIGSCQLHSHLGIMQECINTKNDLSLFCNGHIKDKAMCETVKFLCHIKNSYKETSGSSDIHMAKKLDKL